MAKKENKHIHENINILDVDKSIITVLNNNNINTIWELWVLNRKTLKEFGIKDSDIKQITIQLQLLGLDLNKKIYN